MIRPAFHYLPHSLTFAPAARLPPLPPPPLRLLPTPMTCTPSLASRGRVWRVRYGGAPVPPGGAPPGYAGLTHQTSNDHLSTSTAAAADAARSGFDQGPRAPPAGVALALRCSDARACHRGQRTRKERKERCLPCGARRTQRGGAQEDVQAVTGAVM